MINPKRGQTRAVDVPSVVDEDTIGEEEFAELAAQSPEDGELLALIRRTRALGVSAVDRRRARARLATIYNNRAAGVTIPKRGTTSLPMFARGDFQ